MEVTKDEVEKLARYMTEVQVNADKFSNYMQATAAMFDMNLDEVGMTVSNLLHAAILNMLGDESDESVANTLRYIDAVSSGLASTKDMIISEHMENRKG